jgi:hypothetical protein
MRPDFQAFHRLIDMFAWSDPVGRWDPVGPFRLVRPRWPVSLGPTPLAVGRTPLDVGTRWALGVGRWQVDPVGKYPVGNRPTPLGRWGWLDVGAPKQRHI